MNASEVILDKMKKEKITYRELGERAGVSQQCIWSILNGKVGNKTSNKKGSRDPKFGSLQKLCDAMDLEMVAVPTGKQPDIRKLLRDSDFEDLPYSAAVKTIEATGYSLKILKKN